MILRVLITEVFPNLVEKLRGRRKKPATGKQNISVVFLNLEITLFRDFVFLH